MSELKEKMAWWMRDACELTHDECLPLVAAALAAIEDSGYAIVPSRETTEQLKAGQRAWNADPAKLSSTLYRAMVEAGKVKP